MALSGSCLCGRVRYEIVGDIGASSHCHCSMCRKFHGAAFGTYAHVDDEKLRWSGEEYIQRYQSSARGTRLFCRNCGSSLMMIDPGGSFIALGTLDSEPQRQPVCHIFVASRAPWYEISDQLQQFPAGPPPR